MKKWFRRNYRYIVFFISIILFVILLWNVFAKEIMGIDVYFYDFIKKYLFSDFFTSFFKFVTNLGGVSFICLLTALLVVFVKNNYLKIMISANLVFITVLNLILKNLVQRPRPTEFRIIDESGYSFPSGHSMVSMAVYGFIIYLIVKYVKVGYLKLVSIILLLVLISLIGISRIYLGVHYTSDVIAGFCITVGYLSVFTSMVSRRIRTNEK